MLWQSAASVSRCRSYQWRNLSSALCNRKRFDQCCSLSDLYPERVNQVMPCRGVGLGDGKVQFRPIITYCFGKGNGSRCHLPNYHIISAESWKLLTCRLPLREYFDGVISDQYGFCQMLLDSFLFIHADYHKILISVLLSLSALAKSARLVSKLDQESIQRVSQFLRLFLVFLISFLQLFLTLHALYMSRILKLLCAGF